MIQIADYNISIINHGNFKLDGGAMFGSVPKPLWSKLIAADDQNRIPLATNSLLLEGHSRTILIDVGMGDKWTARQKQIFAIEPNLSLALPKITDIVLTHLHFDHCGGISEIIDQKLALKFPEARVWLQKENYSYAQNPGIKERASYLADNISPLAQAKLELVDGDKEILPYITVHRIDGHTVGQQWIEIADKDKKLFFPSDLLPTSNHIHLAYHLGYDRCAHLAISEKDQLLARAVAEDALVVFQHDTLKQAARVAKNGSDNYRIVDN